MTCSWLIMESFCLCSAAWLLIGQGVGMGVWSSGRRKDTLFLGWPSVLPLTVLHSARCFHRIAHRLTTSCSCRQLCMWCRLLNICANTQTNMYFYRLDWNAQMHLFIAVLGNVSWECIHVCCVHEDVCDTLSQQFISVKLSCLSQTLLFSLTLCNPEPPQAKHLKTYRTNCMKLCSCRKPALSLISGAWSGITLACRLRDQCQRAVSVFSASILLLCSCMS